MTATAMPLAVMQAEVAAYVEEKGWNVDPVSFEAAMALLHEEVAEAGHAWRAWGLKDMTTPEEGRSDTVHFHHPEEPCVPSAHPVPKPEGVGSEFADILIRLLDDSDRFYLGIPRIHPRTARGFAPVSGEFLTNVNVLHGLIARATMDRQAGGDPAVNLTGVLVFLEQLCEVYGIDLMAEYTRKMAYNRTRPYRHGGRRA